MAVRGIRQRDRGRTSVCLGSCHEQPLYHPLMPGNYIANSTHYTPTHHLLRLQVRWTRTRGSNTGDSETVRQTCSAGQYAFNRALTCALLLFECASPVARAGTRDTDAMRQLCFMRDGDGRYGEERSDDEELLGDLHDGVK